MKFLAYIHILCYNFVLYILHGAMFEGLNLVR